MRYLISILAATLLIGCASKPMTFEARQRFNSAPWAPECVIDEQGYPVNREAGLLGCKDYRLSNHWSRNHRKDATLKTGDGFYVKPLFPLRPDDLEIPEDMVVVWYDQVSKTEVVCYTILYNQGANPMHYPTACYDRNLKTAHVTRGDWAALEHEIMHHKRGDFHDIYGNEKHADE